jgi:ACR3 family arsenite transporter
VQRAQAHLSRWLLGYALAMMALGLGGGQLASGWTGQHHGLVAAATTVMVFLVIYPMMVSLKFEALRQAGHNVKGLALALAFNFVWAPLLGLALAKIFLPDPLLAIGFLLVMVVPCSSMTVAYTGLAKGNVGLATMSVALSFVVALIAVPAWMLVFASGYQVQVPISSMLTSIGTVLLAPMILGFGTRKLLTTTMGHPRFARLQPVFPIASMLAMFAIIFLIFFGKSDLIVAKWATVLLLLVPNALFIAITLIAVTWVDHRLHLGYGDHMAVVFASTGKNNGTAIAIAATAFSPLVAVPAATMPIFQVILLIGYLKLADRIRARFARAHHSAGDRSGSHSNRASADNTDPHRLPSRTITGAATSDLPQGEPIRNRSENDDDYDDRDPRPGARRHVQLAERHAATLDRISGAGDARNGAAPSPRQRIRHAQGRWSAH